MSEDGKAPSPETANDELIRCIAERMRRENAREDLAVSRRLEEARKEALRLAGRLSGLSGLRRVYLFGSAAAGRFFRVDSDLDLAIEGGDLLQAMALTEDSTFDVDVVDLALVREDFRHRVLSEGVLLYEKNC